MPQTSGASEPRELPIEPLAQPPAVRVAEMPAVARANIAWLVVAIIVRMAIERASAERCPYLRGNSRIIASVRRP